MKRTLTFGAAALAVLLVGTTGWAQAGTESQKPSPESQKASPTPATNVGPGFVDEDGDGICDRRSGQDRGQARCGRGQGKGGHGPRDGSGNKGVGPRDGSGYGRGSANCDGTGPKGRGRRGGRR